MPQDRIAQKRIDALCARILHERSLRTLRRLSLTVDVLALVVPVGYMTVRFLAKGTAYEPVAEFIWACVAAALLILSITKMVFKWTDKSQQHSRLIGENISLVTHANYLLSKSPSPDSDTAQLFFLFSDTIEKADRDLLGTPPATSKQNAYREALKELGHDVTCPVCKASPWHYTPGSCQACGNTPASTE
jgi:mobilome CxxCx(11)CxxC protein